MRGQNWAERAAHFQQRVPDAHATLLPMFSSHPTHALSVDDPHGAQAADALPISRPDMLWSDSPVSIRSGVPGAPSPDWELCCSGPAVAAPKAQAFVRDPSVVIARSVLIWDPHCLWPSDLLGRVDPALPGIAGSTRLRRADQTRAFAHVHHWHGEASDGDHVAVFHVQGRDDGVSSANLALSMLETASHGGIVTGSASDRDLPLKVEAFCRRAAWRGPVVHLLTIGGKPARADKLRRLVWPRGFKTRLTAYSPSKERPWLADCLARLSPQWSLNPSIASLDDAAIAVDSDGPKIAEPGPRHPSFNDRQPIGIMSTAPAMTPSIHPVIDFRTRTSGASSISAALTIPDGTDPAALREALGCAHLCFGLFGVAVVDARAGLLLASTGETALLCEAARALDALLSGQIEGAEPPVVTTERDGLITLAVPVARRPGLWLLGLSSPVHAEIAHVRWQLQVASNTLAPAAG